MSLPLAHDTLDDVDAELTRAQEKFLPMHSAHEAYGVLLEELDEFWDEVKMKVQDRAAMRRELIQVAAMAVRAIEDLGL